MGSGRSYESAADRVEVSGEEATELTAASEAGKQVVADQVDAHEEDE